jgi:hypothetical protein
VAGDGCGNAAARGESADDAAASRPAGRHEVIEQAIDEGFVKHALVAVALEVELERFQLDAQRAGRIGERNGAEIGLAGLGTETGELGADDLDSVIASRLRIGEGFQLLGGRGINDGHSFSSDNFVAKKNPAVSLNTAGFIFVKSAWSQSQNANMIGCRPPRERRSGDRILRKEVIQPQVPLRLPCSCGSLCRHRAWTISSSFAAPFPFVDAKNR